MQVKLIIMILISLASIEINAQDTKTKSDNGIDWTIDNCVNEFNWKDTIKHKCWISILVF